MTDKNVTRILHEMIQTVVFPYVRQLVKEEVDLAAHNVKMALVQDPIALLVEERLRRIINTRVHVVFDVDTKKQRPDKNPAKSRP